MSVETPAASEPTELSAPSLEQRTAPEPAVHGVALTEVFNDASGEYGLEGRETLYDRAITYWREHVGDREAEPHVVELDDRPEWLPPARDDREYVLELTSSRWKAGTGLGDDYSAYYDQHIKLRERDDEGETHKGPIALHVELMPQFDDLVHKDGTPLENQYGEGTRIAIWSTWVDSPEGLERRAYDALEAVYGEAAVSLKARNDRSRRIQKAEAHHRFDIGWKKQVIDALENSKQLIAYGGGSEIDAHSKRQREGWLEALVDADRWHLLGFSDELYNRGVKVYQAANWHKKNRSDPAHHPKIEAFFSGVEDGPLPHVDQWGEVLQGLRQLVSAHLDWAGVGREQLVADDYQEGGDLPAYTYKHPEGRREQLRQHFESVKTEIYRESLKENTESLYDILRTLAIEQGATYDVLEQRTGLARSTIRHHVRRLDENGVVERLGNPVLVVFPSLEVLDDADEILREINPDDTLEDMRDRAEERRENRESNDQAQLDDESDQDGSADDADRGRWKYLEQLPLTTEQLCSALGSGAIDEKHVRIKVSEYPRLPPP